MIYPWILKQRGILGMNKRNIDYISRYNPRRLYPLVDDKLQSKLLAEEANIPVPELITTLKSQHDVAYLKNKLEGCSGFAIKPAKGSGGKGIMVLSRVDEQHFSKSSGQVVGLQDLQRHASNILAGLYSLGGAPDVAIIERLIEFNPLFKSFSHEGVPDIRVIIFKGFPVMAMMRLATRDSDGKANLHQGAIGVGLDIATGKPLHAVQHGKSILTHPDTGQALSELKVDHWQELLTLAASCYEMSGLGYLGADIVLDNTRGPMLLELNARPGLSIQVANGVGLLHRLKPIEKIDRSILNRDAAARVAFAQDAFASDSLIEDRI
ncbi:alpha-L-glutamate ligase-like protein [Bermanella marisrubri]|uniref:Glutathione synthase/Ribosomal protein S6 modification enzyme (Glutaminyl transferase) n=1 Tax=Bermanella marisrubri TaxID=207949 RepID=Q1N2A4_9GAMM|nr:alpha-L-glutamate ligase-like protein [Bermanella marisrubri]EAT12260.1 glutathione synthase/Ribosomal protein S6 modification enzyme (glutaminyl transferase) [Bermanella marisrubri]QIZ85352.1 alpha-L-glutamate ligase-like protein [Bermanella marisrubri]